MTPKLTSDFWVRAYLRRLQLVDIPAFITAKGDATAGAVIVKLNTLDGNAKAFHRSYDLDGNRVWATLAEGAERDVDASLTKQRSFDPDIWVIEVESRDGRHLLDEDGLSG
jgi:hypothetical protein